MFRLFISANTRVSGILNNRLPWRFRRDFFLLYYEMVTDLIRRQRPGFVLDVGCGRQTFFPHSLRSLQTAFVGLDSEMEELRHNRDLSYLVVADATRDLPFADSSVDLVTTRSVLEHLTDTNHFFRESYRVLSSGGYAIHIMPGRNAPFAILNRLLSNRVTKRLLSLFYPEIKGGWGFPAYYNNCTFKSIQAALELSGLKVEQIHCRYYQATYFRAFLPAYLLFLTYDLLLWVFQAKRMASQIIVVACKKDNRSTIRG